MSRRPKPNLADVAARAGVGSATVDRVLNERGNVSEETVLRVLEAARALGLKRILPQSHHSLLRIEVILARPDLPLIGRFLELFRTRARSFGRSVVIQRKVLKDEEPGTMAHALRETGADAVITYVQGHPDVREAIADLKVRGVPVVTVIGDIPGSDRLAYAGTDHVKAGRTVGHLMACTARQGPVILLCNHLGFQSHADRVQGFRCYLADIGSPLEIVEVVEGRDDPVLSLRGLRAALKQHPNTVGIYNLGAANAAGGEAIRTSALEAPPVFIGQELTTASRLLLREGTMTFAIDQNPEDQASYAVAVLMHHFRFEGTDYVTTPYVSPVTFTLYGPENI
jgi:LacI family transcriptional regulator